MNYRPFTIISTGYSIPSRKVLSDDIDTRMGLPQGSVQRAGGLAVRHVAGPCDTAASLGAEAAVKALDAAGLSLADIDCLVAASGTIDQGLPFNAALILAELGQGGLSIPSFDVCASCLSFIAALDTISWPLAAGRYENVLVVSSDIPSCALDWTKLEGSAIFGDGAAAAIISSKGGTGSVLASRMSTVPDGVGLCRIEGGGTRNHPSRTGTSSVPMFAMEGKEVFKETAKHLPVFLDSLLVDAGVNQADIDLVIPHQASNLGLAYLSKRLGFDKNKVINIFSRFGNQVGASLPTALAVANEENRLQKGQTVLLLGSGAGLTLGGMVLCI